MNDIDIALEVKREDFEAVISNFLDRIEKKIKKL
jgi:hypothetical protein